MLEWKGKIGKVFIVYDLGNKPNLNEIWRKIFAPGLWLEEQMKGRRVALVYVILCETYACMQDEIITPNLWFEKQMMI